LGLGIAIGDFLTEMVGEIQEERASGGAFGMFVFDGFLFFRIHIGAIGFETAPGHGLPISQRIHTITPPSASF